MKMGLFTKPSALHFDVLLSGEAALYKIAGAILLTVLAAQKSFVKEEKKGGERDHFK